MYKSNLLSFNYMCGRSWLKRVMVSVMERVANTEPLKYWFTPHVITTQIPCNVCYNVYRIWLPYCGLTYTLKSFDWCIVSQCTKYISFKVWVKWCSWILYRRMEISIPSRKMQEYSPNQKWMKYAICLGRNQFRGVELIPWQWHSRPMNKKPQKLPTYI